MIVGVFRFYSVELFEQIGPGLQTPAQVVAVDFLPHIKTLMRNRALRQVVLLGVLTPFALTVRALAEIYTGVNETADIVPASIKAHLGIEASYLDQVFGPVGVVVTGGAYQWKVGNIFVRTCAGGMGAP